VKKSKKPAAGVPSARKTVKRVLKGAGKAAMRKSTRGKKATRPSVRDRARRAATMAAERLSPALERAMESAGEALSALRRTAASTGRAVDRGGVASKPIQRMRSVIAESLHRLEPKIRPLRLLLLDVDGVLTDGGIWYLESGEEMKRFDIQDGMGVDLLQRAGIQVGVLTGRRSEVVERRCRELGIGIVKQGFYDKSAGLAEILEEEGLDTIHVGYVGDDVQDLAVMGRVGFSAAPANAAHEVQVSADYVTSRTGGRGAVREVAELLLTALGRRKEVIDEASAPGTTPPAGRGDAASY
jgi:3-deoxy-D-manno-octulosonate 8-phosphate phosphatase (KDO 8-P phosphatase)